MLTSMRLSSVVALSVFLLGETVSAGGPLCVANRCPHRRALEFGDVGKNAIVQLDKRQNDPYSTVYYLSTIPPWAALPYSSCGGVSTGTTTICPVDYYCHCNSGTSRLCLPTSTITAPTATITSSCSLYTGSMSDARCQFTWSTTLTEMAQAWGQCGGYTSTVLAQAWDEQTLCPVNYRCAPTNFWYKQCQPATMTATVPNPMTYWGCGGGYYPLATKEGMQCGGHCLKANGKPDGACPGTLSCWTRTYPKPGFEATCYSTSPPGGVWATSLCYPIPYDWPGYGGPTCKPQTAQTQTPYGQCGGSTVNAYNSNIAWPGPQKCQCGYQCNSSVGGNYANCNPIPNFVNTCNPSLGPGTQSLFGRCGGSLYSSNTLMSWTYPTMCPAGATCSTDPGGWYAQCTSVVQRRQKRAPSPSAEPVVMAAPEPTPEVPFIPVYEAAVPASRPKI